MLPKTQGFGGEGGENSSHVIVALLKELEADSLRFYLLRVWIQEFEI